MLGYAPHDVDSLTEVGHDPIQGTPWEKIGTLLPENATLDETLTLAGLNWSVDKRPLAWAGLNWSVDNPDRNYHDMEDAYALVKMPGKHVLSPYVGTHYKPIQNDVAFQVFRDFVLAGNMKMETAGSIKQGQHIWGLAKIAEHFELANGEVINGYFLLVQSHKYGHSLRAMFTPVRYPGGLTLVRPIGVKGSGTFRMSHNRKFDEDRIKEIRKLLGVAQANLDRFVQTAKFLQETRLPERQAVKFLAKVFAPKKKDTESEPVLPDTLGDLAQGSDYGRTLQDVAQYAPTFFKNEPQGNAETAWGYYNLVASYIDKMAGRGVDSRLESAWFGANARRKGAAFEDIKLRAIHKGE